MWYRGLRIKQEGIFWFVLDDNLGELHRAPTSQAATAWIDEYYRDRSHTMAKFSKEQYVEIASVLNAELVRARRSKKGEARGVVNVVCALCHMFQHDNAEFQTDLFLKATWINEG